MRITFRTTNIRKMGELLKRKTFWKRDNLLMMHYLKYNIWLVFWRWSKLLMLGYPRPYYHKFETSMEDLDNWVRSELIITGCICWSVIPQSLSNYPLFLCLLFLWSKMFPSHLPDKAYIIHMVYIGRTLSQW